MSWIVFVIANLAIVFFVYRLFDLGKRIIALEKGPSSLMIWDAEKRDLRIVENLLVLLFLLFAAVCVGYPMVGRLVAYHTLPLPAIEWGIFLAAHVVIVYCIARLGLLIYGLFEEDRPWGPFIVWDSEQRDLALIGSLFGYLGAGLVAICVAYPGFAHMVLYQFLLCTLIARCSLWLLPLFLCGIAVRVFLRTGARENKALSISFGAIALALTVFFVAVFDSLDEWNTAQRHKPLRREGSPIVDANRIRHSTPEMAARAMHQRSDTGNYGVEFDYVWQTEWNSRVGYSAVQTAKSEYLEWFGTTPGVVFFDDSPDVARNERVEKIPVRMSHGPDRKFMDNAMRKIRSLSGDIGNIFCEMPDRYVYELDGRWAYVFPRVRQKISWLGLLDPVPAGVAILFEDGEYLGLSNEEAKNYEPLKGKVIFPSTLMKRYVDVRNFDDPDGGFFADLLRGMLPNEHRIRIPETGSHNTMPYHIPAADGATYLTVLTEPDSVGSSLTREIYYVDGTTGEFSCYAPPDGTMGLRSALEQVRLAHDDVKWAEARTDLSLDELSETASQGFTPLAALPISFDGRRVDFMVPITTDTYEDNGRMDFVNGLTGRVFPTERRSEYFAYLEAGKDLFAKPSVPEQLADNEPARQVVEEANESSDALLALQHEVKELRGKIDASDKKLDAILRHLQENVSGPAKHEADEENLAESP